MFSANFFLSLLAALIISSVSHAERSETVNSEVLLTVSGNFAVKNFKRVAEFDRPMLKRMRRVEFETSTMWTEGVKVFSGVPLIDVLQAIGTDEGTTVIAKAMDGHEVQIPISSLTEAAPIIAYEIDGNELSVRKKGPLWVVYPYDSEDSFQTAVIYSRSIWQLDRLFIK